MQIFLYLFGSALLLGVIAVYLEHKYPYQFQKVVTAGERLKFGLSLLLSYLTLALLSILDYVHLVLSFFITLILGGIFVTLFFMSGSNFSKFSDDPKIYMSPLSFLSNTDWHLLWSNYFFAFIFGVIFYFALSHFFISWKVTLIWKKKHLLSFKEMDDQIDEKSGNAKL
jgi:hypothetical protein